MLLVCVHVCICAYESFVLGAACACRSPLCWLLIPCCLVYLDLVTWQKISSNKHCGTQPVSLSHALTNLPTTIETPQWMQWQSAKRSETWMRSYACAQACLAPWASMWACRFVFVHAWVSLHSCNNKIIACFFSHYMLNKMQTSEHDYFQ